MDTFTMVLQLLVVIGAIVMGTRTGGIGLGVWGLVGMLVLIFVFRVAPGNAPTDAVFIVITVIMAASVMQAAGGTDWMVGQAAKVITRHPGSVTYVAPFMAFLFTVGAGTGNIYYPLLPVIYQTSYAAKIRPERPLAVAAVASQVGIVASPVSAATASLAGLLDPEGFSLGKILLIMWPASIVGIIAAAFVMSRKGPELDDDPVYQERLAQGLVDPPQPIDLAALARLPKSAGHSAMIFFGGVAVIVVLGLFPALRPTIGTGDSAAQLSVTTSIQLVMGAVAALIFVVCKPDAGEVPKQSTFGAGMVGAIALFGLAWLANTFVSANQTLIVELLGNVVQRYVILFALALFVVAALTTSQSSATNAIVPIGLSLGLAPGTITAMWSSVIGIYFLPANGSQIATVNFDQTGTTKIGRAVVNHSFMLPLLVFAVVGIAVGFLMSVFV